MHFSSRNIGHSHDSIFTFTDGEPVVGITDADELVKEFKRRVERNGRRNTIPVSAFAIGASDEGWSFMSKVILLFNIIMFNSVLYSSPTIKTI